MVYRMLLENDARRCATERKLPRNTRDATMAMPTTTQPVSRVPKVTGFLPKLTKG
ncbi:hypothetical protein GCM10022414_14090 [Zhongshania borealis]|uniref:Uncharacterized protein n=1 Tax=Zhongshania borealis TaxID=889488 RepID=A0ABP7WLU1_9GAMM